MKTKIKTFFMALSFICLVIVAIGGNTISANAASKNTTYYFSPHQTTKFQVKNNTLTVKVSKADSEAITKKGDKKYKKYSLKLKVANNSKYFEEFFDRGNGGTSSEKSSYKTIKNDIKNDREYYKQYKESTNTMSSCRIVVKNNKVVKIVYSMMGY